MILKNFVFVERGMFGLTKSRFHKVVRSDGSFPGLRCVDDRRFQLLHAIQFLEVL